MLRLFGACLPRGPSGASAPLLAPATRAPATRSAPQAGHPRSTSTTRPCLSQTGAGWRLSSTWGVGFRTVAHCTLTSKSVSLLFLPARLRRPAPFFPPEGKAQRAEGSRDGHKGGVPQLVDKGARRLHNTCEGRRGNVYERKERTRPPPAPPVYNVGGATSRGFGWRNHRARYRQPTPTLGADRRSGLNLQDFCPTGAPTRGSLFNIVHGGGRGGPSCLYVHQRFWRSSPKTRTRLYVPISATMLFVLFLERPPRPVAEAVSRQLAQDPGRQEQ